MRLHSALKKAIVRPRLENLMKSNRTKLMALKMGLCSIALGFHATVSIAQTPKDPSLPGSFYSGDLRLSYSMMGKGASGGQELLAMYNNGEWVALVKAIQEKRFVVSTYYFYLGRAAEELGYPNAAVKYFDLAINATKFETCTVGGLWNTCAGFSLPADAIARKELVLNSRIASGKHWPLGEGPLITAALPPMETIKEAAKRSSSATPQLERGKFETEEDFKKRASSPSTRFLVMPLSTRNEGRCKTSYSHDSGTYQVIKCTVFDPAEVIADEQIDGKPLVLANAFDRREIRRVLHHQYRLNASLNWKADYKLAVRDAEALDADLAAGIEVSGLAIQSKCSACDSRDRQDSLRSLSSALGANSSAGTWRDEAFKTGVIDEDWTHVIQPTKILRYVIFRKSDQRILFERMEEQ